MSRETAAAGKRKRSAEPQDPLVLTIVSGYALLQTNELVPVTNMYDLWGNDTDDESEAVSAVAGPTLEGKWIAFEIPEPPALM